MGKRLTMLVLVYSSTYLYACSFVGGAEQTPTEMPDAQTPSITNTAGAELSQPTSTVDYEELDPVPNIPITSLCPDDRIVDFEELDIKPSYTLAVSGQEQSNIYILDGDNVHEVEIAVQNLRFDTQFSPNREWYLFTLTEFTSDQASIEWYVSSVWGDDSWMIYEGNEYETLRWRSDEIIEVWDASSGPMNTCHQRVLDINPFILEITQSEPVPTEGFPFCSPFINAIDPLNPETRFIFRDDEGTNWYLEDRAEGTAAPIFKWLEGERFWNLSELTLYWTHSGFTVIRPITEHEIEIVRDLSVEEAGSSMLQPELVILPGQWVSDSLVWEGIDYGVLGLDLVDNDVVYDETYYFGDNSEAKFYVLDLNTLTLYDYCLRRINPAYGGIVMPSPDGRFLAWEEYNNNVNVIRILDRNTGLITEIREWFLLTWLPQP